MGVVAQSCLPDTEKPTGAEASNQWGATASGSPDMEVLW